MGGLSARAAADADARVAGSAKGVDLVVALPMLLDGATGGAREVLAHGATLAACLGDLLAKYPLLRVHLYEADGRLRKHVLILYNDQNIRWLETLELPVAAGDRLTILQAVTGG